MIRRALPPTPWKLFTLVTSLAYSPVLTSSASAAFYEGRSKHDSVPVPVSIWGPVIGQSSDAFHTEWTRRKGFGQGPIALSSCTVDGITRYSAIFHRDPSSAGMASYRSMSESTYRSRWNALKAEGYRVIDVTTRFASSGAPLYDAVWTKDKVPTGWQSWTDFSESDLLLKILALKTEGYRPVRINMGVNAAGAIRYSAAFVKDGLDFRVALGKSDADYSAAWDSATGAGYAPLDLSVVTHGGSAVFTGIWLKDPRIGHYESRRNLTRAELDEKMIEQANANAVGVDVEEYRTSSQGELRYAAIWHQRGQDKLSGSSPVSDQLQTQVQTAIRAQGAKVGFFVEDLKTGEWIAYNADEPFYLASTTKVFIGSRAMEKVGAGELNWTANVSVPQDYIRETLDSPNTAGSYPFNNVFGWMINSSSTNATDTIETLLNRETTNDFAIRKNLDSLGEITPICELDRRVHEIKDACVRGISCEAFERFSREGAGPATRAERSCINNASPGDAEYAKYYATLANSTTPAEYGRFWRKLLRGDLMPLAQRNQYLATLRATVSTPYTGNISGSSNYNRLGSKNGVKSRVHTWVAIAWDQRGASVSETSDQARYSLSFFTEQWPNPTGSSGTTMNPAAQALIATLAGYAVNHLKSLSP